MICEDAMRNHAGWKRLERNARALLLALFFILIGGSVLLNWAPKSVAVESQNEAVEARNEAAETQGEAGKASVPAEEEKSAEEEKGTLDSIKGVFSSWGHKAGIKKDRLSVKYDMRKLRDKIEENYQELGRVFFALYRDGAPDILNDPELKAVLGSIVEKQAELQKLEARLAELRAEEEGEESGEGAGEVQEGEGSAVEEKSAD